MKTSAAMLALLSTLAFRAALAANTQPVVVTNPSTAPVPVTGSVTVRATDAVPVTGSVAISRGTVTVTNSASSPLFVSPASASPATSRIYTDSITFTQSGTLSSPTLDVQNCAKLRLGAGTSFTGDTVEIRVVNDLGIALDTFIVGTLFGDTNTTQTRTYDVPGLTVSLSLTLQGSPTGNPITLGMWCLAAR